MSRPSHSNVIDERDLADQLHEALALVEILNMATHAIDNDTVQQNAMQHVLFDLNAKITAVKDTLAGEPEERSDRS